VSIVPLLLHYMVKDDQVSSYENTRSRPTQERNPSNKLRQHRIWKVTG